jgi:hypothetical protein
MNSPTVYSHTRFREGTLPSEDMGINGINQRSVKIED